MVLASETLWTLRVLEAMIIHAQAWLDSMFTHLPLELIAEVDTLCVDMAVFQCHIQQKLAGDMDDMEKRLEDFVKQYKELKQRVRFTYWCRFHGPLE